MTISPIQKIGIIGIGAMGCLFGAHLSPLAEVVLLGHWPAQLAALASKGLTLVGIDSHSSQIPLRATNDPAEIDSVDLALILVKSFQTAQAVQSAREILKPGGLALSLQNGLGNLEQLTAVLGPESAALGSTSQGATMLNPGTVKHAGHGPTQLAVTPMTMKRITAVAELFNQAGLQTSLVDDLESLIWGKLAVNTGINPLTALLNVKNGFLSENEKARSVMMAAARETATLAQRLGIILPYSDAGERALEVAQATADNYSSMLQDIIRGAPTEIEAICGAVVRNGRRANIPTPINTELLRLIKLKETGDRRLRTEKTLISLYSQI